MAKVTEMYQDGMPLVTLPWIRSGGRRKKVRIHY
jgi:hypothetical protein